MLMSKKQTSSPPPSSIQHHYHLCASVCASFWPASINRINKMQTQTQTYIHLKITQLHRCTWYFLHDLGHMVTMKRLKWKWGKSCNIYCHTNHKTKIKRIFICRGNTHTYTHTEMQMYYNPLKGLISLHEIPLTVFLFFPITGSIALLCLGPNSIYLPNITPGPTPLWFVLYMSVHRLCFDIQWFL